MGAMLGAKGYEVSYWRVASKHRALGPKDVTQTLGPWRLRM